MDLRERLIAADEAHDPCSNSGGGQGREPHWWCNCGAESDEPTALDANKAAYEHMADVNQAVVAAWLRDASTAQAVAEETTEYHWYSDSDDSCACGQWRDGDGSIHANHVAQVGLAFLADAIDPQPERTAP